MGRSNFCSSGQFVSIHLYFLVEQNKLAPDFCWIIFIFLVNKTFEALKMKGQQ